MSPSAWRILLELSEDKRRDLVREGIHAYCGSRPVASRTVTELLYLAAIRPLYAGNEPGATYFVLSDMGERYLRRPELADEYVAAVKSGAGPFTIENDRIVRLGNP